MKQLTFILLPIFCTLAAAAQKSFSVPGFDGATYSFSGSTISNSSNESRSVSSSNSVPSTTIPDPRELEAIFGEHVQKQLNEARQAWNKDWNKVERKLREARAYDSKIKKAYYDALLKDVEGYKLWDMGADEANKRNWDKAIEQYIKALKYFPKNLDIISGIVGCAYSKTFQQATRAYEKKDWVSAAAYSRLLINTFYERSVPVQEVNSQSLAQLKLMKNEKGYLRYEQKLEEARRQLPIQFIDP